MKMGKWFHGSKARLRAEERAKQIGGNAYEILYTEDDYRAYYAGFELPKAVKKKIGKSAHVLCYYKNGGEPCLGPSKDS